MPGLRPEELCQNQLEDFDKRNLIASVQNRFEQFLTFNTSRNAVRPTTSLAGLTFQILPENNGNISRKPGKSAPRTSHQ